MKYVDGVLCGAVFASGLFLSLVAIGAAVKTVQWIGQKLGVPRLDVL